MNLNSISIGGGLALVAVGLLANAAASLVGSPDRTANADDLNRAAKNPQSVADVPVSRADEGGAEMVAGSECQPADAEVLNWFGEIRELPMCYDLYVGNERLPLSVLLADVNQDGVDEAFEFTGGYIVPCSPTAYVEPFLVRMRRLTFVAEQVVDERFMVLDRVRVATWLLENYPQSQGGASMRTDASGWFDIDSDGDLDFVMGVNFNLTCSASAGERLFWLENTGFEKQAYAAGDINKDGVVDGVDISILLSDWTY